MKSCVRSDIAYTGINLMLPTYGRASTRLPEFVDSAEEMCSDPDNLFYSFMVNKNDADTIAYLECRLGSTGRMFMAYEDEKAPHLAKFWNRLCDETAFNEPGIMVSMVGDDMIFKSEYWDEMLLDACNEKKGVGVWFGDDCKNTHHSLMVNLFTTRLMKNAQSPFPFMCEAFPCDDMDWVWDHIARRLGIRYYLPEFKLFHNHATYKKENEDDTWRRLREVFPIVQENRKNMQAFVQERLEKIVQNIPELSENKPRVLFVCMGRYGDIVHASIHANKLIADGYAVEWLTIKHYESLISVICPGCSVITRDDDDGFDTWGDPKMQDIENAYQGYDYYVLAQPGATEIHDHWVRSGKSMVDVLCGLVANGLWMPYKRNGLDIEVPVCDIKDVVAYAKADNLPVVHIEHNKPLCVIAPEIISTQAVWPEEGVDGIVRQHSKTHTVLVLTRDAGYSFVECIAILRQCDVFIGQDSGLAWAALFSDCKKIIYHTQKRIEETNMMFSRLNSTYEDIVIDG